MTKWEILRNVKIAGTDFDRRRKLTTEKIQMVQDLYDKGYSISSIADVFNVSYSTIKYHVNKDFRSWFNKNRAKYGRYTDRSMDKVYETIEYKKEILEGKRVVI